MKNQKNELKYYCFLRFILLIIFIDNSLSYVKTGIYPLTKRLNNGNYVIVSSRNITFVDPSFSIAYNSLNFESEIYLAQTDIGSTTISQFSAEYNGYVIIIVVKTLYIFTSKGEYLNQTNITLNNIKFNCFLVTHGQKGNNYYMTLISGSNDEQEAGSDIFKYLNFKKISYEHLTNEILFDDDILYPPPLSEVFYGSSLSCNILNTSKQYITCIYGTWGKTYISLFDPDHNYNNSSTKSVEIGSQFIKSVVIPDENSKIFICLFKSGNPLNFLIYDITLDNITLVKEINYRCGNQQINLILEYFYETENIIAGCKEDGNVVYLTEFSKEFNLTKIYEVYNKTNLFPDNCGDIVRINIIFPQGGNKYSFFYNPNPTCNSNDCQIVENQISAIGSNLSNLHNYPITEPTYLVCPDNLYYNYDYTSCIYEIPPGFYCNSTSERTIDRCHPNCQTCDKGPTKDSNNCLTCNTSELFYFDFGNCVSNCTNGHFTHNGIEKCKCSNDTTCEYCSEESKQQNLCETCNINYYPKKDDIYNKGKLIKCYNDDSISDGYYLNTITSQYEPCHTNCLKCLGNGTDSNNNCTICNSGLSLIKNNQNIENCYSDCVNYFFFDENNEYQCTNTSNCPEGYKLIDGKRKCIDSCSNDNIFNYKYEYKNVCYKNCPNDTTISSSNNYLCELNCKNFNKYFNYEKTECISTIPNGFYCDNNELNTISKCHNNCKTCIIGPDDNNNNCETCKDEGTIYFDLGNCRDECIHDFYIDENSVLKCKCTQNIKCKDCTNQSLNLDLCITCNNNEGYYPKLEEKENNSLEFINCYKDPEGYFLNNIDGNKYYKRCYEKCLSCDELGNETDNKCIECISNYTFKYDFENDKNCYLICPYNYYYDSNGTYKCTLDEICPENYNKLISSKKRCIDDCSKDNSNKYEYNNECILECPDSTHTYSENPYKCIGNLNCEQYGKYYNYNRTACLDEYDIPLGFYCNDSVTKTIDKCHDNCKTCNLGPTDDKNNCETCRDEGKIFFDLGNCTDNCINGKFIDNSINKCKCSTNITCQFCSLESKVFNLCISCNIDLGYYPKVNDDNNINEFINCYNVNTISDGYFLDVEEKKYTSCYFNCKKCSELGNDIDNKCTECKSGYSFIINNNNIKNCYKECHKYYFDSQNNYHCVDICPDGYKSINNTNKCIDDCINDKIYYYKFEYNNICYESCPNGTISIDKNNLCISSKKEHCPEDFPYFDYKLNKCVQKCNVSDLFNKKCSLDNPNNNLKQTNYNNIRNAITSNELGSLLNDLINNEEDLLIL